MPISSTRTVYSFVLAFSLAAYLLATPTPAPAQSPCSAQWFFLSNGTVDTDCARIEVGKSGLGAQIYSDPNAVNMTIRNQTNGTLTLDYSSALSFRQGKGGGPIKFWMDSAGQLGLGTTAPLALLDVRGTTRTAALEITGGSVSSASDLRIQNSTTGSVLVLLSNGDVCIGSGCP